MTGYKMTEIGVATTGFEDLGIRTLSYRSSQRTRLMSTPERFGLGPHRLVA